VRSAPPDRPDARPPLASSAAPSSGGALRPTIQTRDLVPVRLTNTTNPYLPTDPYVRKFWVAVLGPSAVVDLLRLSQAARRQKAVLRPLHLRGLLEAGLVRLDEEALIVGDRIPPLPALLLERLPVRLRREHAHLTMPALSANGSYQGKRECDQFAHQEPHAHPEPGAAASEKHGCDPSGQSGYPSAG